jgi:hypothetical protein
MAQEEDFVMRDSILDAFKMSTENIKEENETDNLDEEVLEEEQEEEIQEELEEQEEVEEDQLEEETEETEEFENSYDDEVSDISFSPLASFLAENGELIPDPEKEYEDSAEGLAEMIQDTVEAKRREWVDSLGPDAVNVLRFIENGGAIQDYVEATQNNTYSNIDMEDPDNWNLLVAEHMRMTGMDEEDIEEYVRDLEDTGMIERHAQKAQKYLEKKADNDLASLLQQQEQARIEADQQKAIEQQEFVNTILNGKVGDFEIPKKERNSFLQYLTDPVSKDGKTLYQLEDNYEDRIKLAYFKFKKFDFSDVEKKAKTKALIEIKKSMSRYTDTLSKGNSNIHNVDTNESNMSRTKLPNLPWNTRFREE